LPDGLIPLADGRKTGRYPQTAHIVAPFISGYRVQPSGQRRQKNPVIPVVVDLEMAVLFRREALAICVRIHIQLWVRPALKTAAGVNICT